MKTSDAFTSRVFLIAGVYGLATLQPQFFLEETLGRHFPPSLNHPENFYGFIGVATVWQFAFLLIANDVQRYRLFILPSILEKLSFGIASFVLYFSGRTAQLVACAGSVDLLFATLFIVAFRKIRRFED